MNGLTHATSQGPAGTRHVLAFVEQNHHGRFAHAVKKWVGTDLDGACAANVAAVQFDATHHGR